MDRNEMLQMITNIGTQEDEAERRAMLTTLTDEVNGLFDSNDKLTSDNSKFEADNKKLQEYNMQLFLRVGSGKEKPKPEQNDPDDLDLKFTDLFNEKGELK